MLPSPCGRWDGRRRSKRECRAMLSPEISLVSRASGRLVQAAAQGHPGTIRVGVDGQGGAHGPGPIGHGVQPHPAEVPFRGRFLPPVAVVLHDGPKTVAAALDGHAEPAGPAVAGGIENGFADDIVQMRGGGMIQGLYSRIEGDFQDDVKDLGNFVDQGLHGRFEAMLDDVHRIEPLGEASNLFGGFADQHADGRHLPGGGRRAGGDLLFQHLAEHLHATQVGSQIVMQVTPDAAALPFPHGDHLPFQTAGIGDIHHGGDALGGARYHIDADRHLAISLVPGTDAELVLARGRIRVDPAGDMVLFHTGKIVGVNERCPLNASLDFFGKHAHQAGKAVVDGRNGEILLDEDRRRAAVLENRFVARHGVAQGFGLPAPMVAGPLKRPCVSQQAPIGR
ncbi:hypothetical protein DESC_500127 [Desulfosarcina cetonica]|nr:hypothetical protein DESC_500127 [Desulfosarcina cetonica]